MKMTNEIEQQIDLVMNSIVETAINITSSSHSYVLAKAWIEKLEKFSGSMNNL